MLKLRSSTPTEIDQFIHMESDPATSGYILPYSHEQHLNAMQQPNIRYLSIYQSNELVGFIILALETAQQVEFRRIVVAAKGKGLGQKAIQLMEAYCKTNLNCTLIWLDVFEKNARGKYIYTKLGYTPFKTQEHNGETLVFMKKGLY